MPRSTDPGYGRERGINLPDTILPIPALTDVDRAGLPFIAGHADLVELSVRNPRDVEDLVAALDGLGDNRLGVLVRIDNAQGVENLPAILLAPVMRRRHAGVMIAPADLAAEFRYERMAELQEEILLQCEAAHLPVVFATRVLDRDLPRAGSLGPTRWVIPGGRLDAVQS